jgi:purine-binding chemotaxis protein CheW
MSATDSSNTTSRFLTFNLDGQIYATPVETVLEINQVLDITPVPKVPAFVKGVINLRGQVVPVIDLRLKFGAPATTATKQTSIIVIDGTNGHMGVIVDAVQSVIELEAGQIEPAPNFDDNQSESWCIGLGKQHDQMIILVDLVGALSKERFGSKIEVKIPTLTRHESRNV